MSFFIIKSKKYGEQTVLIDYDDLDIRDCYKWYIKKGTNTYYVVTHNPNKNESPKIIKLHNILTGLKYVDHINGNGLDNRKLNLRPANPLLNARNRKNTGNNKKHSKYKGVLYGTQKRLKNRWLARIVVNGKQIHLGCFEFEIEAAKAYNEGAIKYFGEYASLNNLEVSNRPL